MPISLSARDRRRGSSRVEILVVVVILVILAALIMPQLSVVRDGPHRNNSCRNFMRALATSLFNYNVRNGHYPGYMNVLERDDRSPFVDPTIPGSTAPLPVSWAVMILSDIDRAPLFDEWRRSSSVQPTATPSGTAKSAGDDRTRFFTDQYIELFVCPNDPPKSRGGLPISYVVNTGLPDRPTVAGSQGGDGPAAPRDQRAHGMFFDNFSDDPRVTPNERERRPMIVMREELVRDPQDKTILLTENVDATDYVFRAATHGAKHWRAVEVQAGCVWRPGIVDATKKPPTMEPPAASARINADAGRGDGRSFDSCRPSSRHPGSVNIAFVGQNVMSLRDTISYYVYAKLMASDDASVDTGDAAVDAAIRSHELLEVDLQP